MTKETDIFNDLSLQNDIQDLVAIEQGVLRANCPLPDLDKELEKIVGKEESSVAPSQQEEEPHVAPSPQEEEPEVATSHRPLLRSIAAALIGAAAMLACVFVWEWTRNHHSEGQLPMAMNAPLESGMSTIQTADGEMITLTLADGTEVKLNSNSKLTYPHQFQGKERLVYLSGEAFFKVQHDSQRPFIVDAGGILTKDLGTSFNIRAYSEKDCKVTLVEGKVAVLNKADNAQPVILEPGQQYSIQEKISSQPLIQSVDAQETTAWADGVFYYHDQTLEHIITELARHYHLTAEFINQESKTKHLDFSIDRNGSASDAISMLNDLGVAKVTLRNHAIVVE